MICVICGHDTDVSNSRPAKKSAAVWRRRYCQNCNTVFSTREKPDLALSIRVKRDNGPLKPFIFAKLLISVHSCLSHRNDALVAASALSSTIIDQLLPAKSGVLDTKEITQVAYAVIKKFDRTAATIYLAHRK